MVRAVLASLAAGCGARITGLHVHAGSGILDAGHWSEMAAVLARVTPRRTSPPNSGPRPAGERSVSERILRGLVSASASASAPPS